MEVLKEPPATTYDLSGRTLDYSLRVIKLCRIIQKDEVGKILANQLIRCATSVGANYHEAQGAQSKADFISKVSISYKEIRETLYWLNLIFREGRFSEEVISSQLIEETESLLKIFSSILLKAKQKP